MPWADNVILRPVPIICNDRPHGNFISVYNPITLSPWWRTHVGKPGIMDLVCMGIAGQSQKLTYTHMDVQSV